MVDILRLLPGWEGPLDPKVNHSLRNHRLVLPQSTIPGAHGLGRVETERYVPVAV